MNFPNSTVQVHNDKAVLIMAVDRVRDIPKYLHKTLSVDSYIKYLEEHMYTAPQTPQTPSWECFETKIDELRDMLEKHTVCNSYYNMLKAIDDKVTELLITTRSIIKETK